MAWLQQEKKKGEVYEARMQMTWTELPMAVWQ